MNELPTAHERVTMGYIEENLADDEKVLFRGKLHWIMFISPLFYFLLSVFFFVDGMGWIIRTFSLEGFNKEFGFTVLVRQVENLSGLGAHTVVGISFLVIALIYTWNRLVRFFTTEIGLTNERLIVKIGLIRVDAVEVQLDKVETTMLHQSVIARILNYGSLAFVASGGTGGNFRWVNNPSEFHKAVQNEISEQDKDC